MENPGVEGIPPPGGWRTELCPGFHRLFDDWLQIMPTVEWQWGPGPSAKSI